MVKARILPRTSYPILTRQLGSAGHPTEDPISSNRVRHAAYVPFAVLPGLVHRITPYMRVVLRLCLRFAEEFTDSVD